MEPGNLDAQLSPIPGCRQGNMADMIFKIEILVLDPIGMIEIERNAHKFLAKATCAAKPILDVPQNLLEACLLYTSRCV